MHVRPQAVSQGMTRVAQGSIISHSKKTCTSIELELDSGSEVWPRKAEAEDAWWELGAQLRPSDEVGRGAFGGGFAGHAEVMTYM